MSIGSRELSLYTDNDYPLYKQTMAIGKNLATKKARGQYDRKKAHKAFLLYLANPAAKKYVKEFGGGPWNKAFTKEDRDDFATQYVEWFEASYKAGEFESVLPKKYQKGATRKKTREALAHAEKTRNNSIGASKARGTSKAKYEILSDDPRGRTVAVEPGRYYRSIADAEEALDAWIESERIDAKAQGRKPVSFRIAKV